MSSIIVIDDQEFQREVCSDILKKDGHRVTTVPGGAEALEHLRKEGYDLALVDIFLEKESGLDVCQKILGLYPEMPLIIMTASPSLDAAITSIRQGVYDFLVKPLNEEMALLAVRRALEKKILIEEKNILIRHLMDSNRLLRSFQRITLLALAAHRPSTVLKKTLKGVVEITSSAGGAFLFQVRTLKLAFPYPVTDPKIDSNPTIEDFRKIHEEILAGRGTFIYPPGGSKKRPCRLKCPAPLLSVTIDLDNEAPGGLILWREKGSKPYNTVDLSVVKTTLQLLSYFLGAYIQQKNIQNENKRLSKKITRASSQMRGIKTNLEKLIKEVEKEKTLRSEALQRLEMINKIGYEVGTFVDIENHLNKVMELCLETMKAEIISLMLYDPESGYLYIKKAIGLPPEIVPRVHVKPQEGISGWVFAKNKPLFTADVEKDSRFKKDSIPQYFTKSLISAPVRLKGKPIGVLNVNNKTDGSPFVSEDLDLLVFVCNEVGVAIDNAKLYEDVQISYFETIRALVRVLEAKDESTKGHSERVTSYCLAIARDMGLSPQKLEILKRAGILHDLGKISVDLSILRKEDKLSDEEFMKVKSHPLVAAEIIKPMKYMKEVQLCIQQHHERADGQGYPQGITDICTEARILAVADAYDAMTSSRPYRPAMSREDALEELRGCSGTQFDPSIVETFISLIEKEYIPRQPEDYSF